MAMTPGGDDDGGSDGGRGGGGGDEAVVDGVLDFMDELEELMEKLQRISKIVIKCVLDHSQYSMQSILTQRPQLLSNRQYVSEVARYSMALHLRICDGVFVCLLERALGGPLTLGCTL